jgi:hypothetical protein
MTTKSNPIMKYFDTQLMDIRVRPIAQPICDLAGVLDSLLPESAEKATALRKLLESMDCVIRAATCQ